MRLFLHSTPTAYLGQNRELDLANLNERNWGNPISLYAMLRIAKDRKKAASEANQLSDFPRF